jgi:hypothetical protein
MQWHNTTQHNTPQRSAAHGVRQGSVRSVCIEMSALWEAGMHVAQSVLPADVHGV